MRLEMLVRVRGFAAANPSFFPESSEGSEALAVVNDAIARVEANAREKLLAAKDGRKARIATRTVVMDHLRVIARTARRVAKKAGVSVDNKLTLGKRRSDVAIVEMADTFITEVSKDPQPHIRLGLEPTFVEDLKNAVKAFQAATVNRTDGRRAVARAQKNIVSALSAGLDAATTLDVLLVNVTKNDPGLLAAWKRDRRIVGENKPRRGAAGKSVVRVDKPAGDPVPKAS